MNNLKKQLFSLETVLFFLKYITFYKSCSNELRCLRKKYFEVIRKALFFQFLIIFLLQFSTSRKNVLRDFLSNFSSFYLPLPNSWRYGGVKLKF